MSRPVIILGAGAVGREVLGNLLAADPSCPIAGFIDDDEATWGSVVDGHVVLGGFDRLVGKEREWVAIGATGYPKSRRWLVERAAQLGLDFTVAVHPSVIFSGPGDPVLRRGVIVSAGTILAPSARLGEHVFVSHGCIVNHDAAIEEGASVFPGAVIAGNVRVGAEALIGTRATILQGLTIGKGAKVGAAALVTRNVPPGVT
ncbi:MAG TPA: acetyltransferase, partial [Dehalococcoidia bacterium]|nr:acetyltransferase [Dehalococcoidia bacterium]